MPRGLAGHWPGRFRVQNKEIFKREKTVKIYMCGCLAFPAPGAPAEWCEKNQGGWCKGCKHMKINKGPKK